MTLKRIADTFRSLAGEVSVAGRYVPLSVPHGIVRKMSRPRPSVGLTACGSVSLSRFATLSSEDVAKQRERVLQYDFT